jgi:hypothetical protein
MSQATQLDAWLKEFPEEETEARIRKLDEELADLRNALSMYRKLARHTNGSKPSRDAVQGPESRPAAIRQVLRESNNEPMHPADIKSVMLNRGWLKSDQLKYFYSAMSTMTKRGHLLRLHDGRYMLPRDRMEGQMMTS